MESVDPGAPECERVRGTRYELGGFAGGRTRSVVENWVLPAPLANPGMLEMFRDRARAPLRNMVPWAGEFAGKYLTSGAQLLRLTGDATLRAALESFVAELVSLQDASGYLGPWPPGYELANAAPNAGDPAKAGVSPTWDSWGHYHVMLGLMLFHEETGDRKALRAARRIADLLCSLYLGGSRRLVETGSTEMNLAPVHSLAMLHRRTGEGRYLELALAIVDEFAATSPAGAPLAGDYYLGALSGRRFHELPKPRWESLHPIMGLAELYRITGREDFRRAFEALWRSIRASDRHSNGGFSSGEKATGNPYDRGAIESCCTVAWIALSVEMLKLTASCDVADELELATLNSALGMYTPSGRWATYNTPMDGIRKASAHEIVFQSREGTPELNCCSVNAPRGLGMISDWAVMRGRDGSVILNWFGPSMLTFPLDTVLGRTLTLAQDTAYPGDGRVSLSVRPSATTRFMLRLRIPGWSERTVAKLNGTPLRGVAPGSYLELDREWRRGDIVELGLDLRPHVWTGRRECQGLAAVYRGPLLLAYDRRLNDMDPADIPPLDLDAAALRKVSWRGPRPPAFLWEARGVDGRIVRLCDFASAGHGGAPYRSWLKLGGGEPRESCYVPPPERAGHDGRGSSA